MLDDAIVVPNPTLRGPVQANDEAEVLRLLDGAAALDGAGGGSAGGGAAGGGSACCCLSTRRGPGLGEGTATVWVAPCATASAPWIWGNGPIVGQIRGLWVFWRYKKVF